jgi:hypothetical protein
MNDQADGMAEMLKVRAKFARSDQMQDAVSRLSVSGFDRSAISLPSSERETVGAKPAFDEADSRQVRTLGASTAAAAAAIAAAGVTVATGGAAAPAVAAAVMAGGAVGGSVFAMQAAASGREQHDRDAKAEDGALILSVRASSVAQRSEAAAILQATGATDIETVI